MSIILIICEYVKAKVGKSSKFILSLLTLKKYPPQALWWVLFLDLSRVSKDRNVVFTQFTHFTHHLTYTEVKLMKVMEKGASPLDCFAVSP